MSIRADIRSLFILRESPVRWPVALQAAIAIGIPTVGCAIAGRADLGLLASSGAFTAIYLASRSRRERAAVLPLFALGLVASSALGVLGSGSMLASLVVLFVVAAVSTALLLGYAVGPPGSIFFVLVAGVSAHLAGPTELGAAGLDGRLVIGMLAIGAVIAYLVVLAPLVVPSVRRADAALHQQGRLARFSLGPIDRVILTRVVIGAAIATIIAAPLGVHRAYWVVVAVVVILQNGHRIRLTALRAAHRVLGTLVGVGLFALVMLVNPAGVWLALLLMALQFMVEVVVIRNYGLALVFITPLALVIAAQGNVADVGATIVERIVDTVIGAVIAVVILAVAFLLRRRAGTIGE